MTTIANKEYSLYNIRAIRSDIIEFSGKIGELLHAVEHHTKLKTVQNVITKLLHYMQRVSSFLCIHLEYAIIRKIYLNQLKRPKEIAYGSCDNYENYSAITGITKFNQSMIDSIVPDHSLNYEDNHDFMSNLPELNRHLKQVTEEQGWIKTHTQCNLILGLIAETGELAEHFQWLGDQCIIWDKIKIDAIAQEVADICIYIIRLADVLGITWHKY